MRFMIFTDICNEWFTPHPVIKSNGEFITISPVQVQAKKQLFVNFDWKMTEQGLVLSVPKFQMSGHFAKMSGHDRPVVISTPVMGN